MLCLADRGFFGVRLFEQAKATGAELLWRALSSAVLPVGEALADGSYLSELSNCPHSPARAALEGIFQCRRPGHRLPIGRCRE
jgi:hypothetical protein